MNDAQQEAAKLEQLANEAAKAKQQEAIQKAREQALQLQAEARARAEAARAKQVCLYQKQLREQQELQKQQMSQQIVKFIYYFFVNLFLFVMI